MWLFHYLHRVALGSFAPSLGPVDLAPVLDGVVVGCVVISVHQAVEAFDAEFLMEISGVVNSIMER